MRLRDLSVSLIVAVALHVMAGYCLGVILQTIDSRRIAPDFMQGLTSIELSLVSVAAPPPPSVPTEPELKQLAAVPQEKVPIQEEQPIEVDPIEAGVQEAFAEATTDVRPRYPLGSRLRGEEGSVTIRVCIDASGRVSDTEVMETSGFPALDKAGIKALRNATFRNTQGALASSTETTVTFRFKLID